MRIISKRRLRDYWQLHPEAESALRAWYKIVSEAAWPNFTDLRQTFPGADQHKEGLQVCIIHNGCIIHNQPHRQRKIFNRIQNRTAWRHRIRWRRILRIR